MRKKAYKRNNYCCWACGIPAGDDPFEQPLEGHERYDINSAEGTIKFLETVALCHSCHNFIHSGRLWSQYRKRRIPRKKVEFIIWTRAAILRSHKLRPFWGTRVIELMLDGHPHHVAMRKAVKEYRVKISDTHYAFQGEWKLIVHNIGYTRKDIKHG